MELYNSQVKQNESNSNPRMMQNFAEQSPTPKLHQRYDTAVKMTTIS